MSEERIVRCGKCSIELAEPPTTAEDDREPCPRCGSTNRPYDVTVATEVKSTVALLRARATTAGGFRIREFWHRNKLSRHGKQARETLDYDHSDPAVTVKRHRVEELDEDSGEWVTRHDEREEYPARNRPTRIGPENVLGYRHARPKHGRRVRSRHRWLRHRPRRASIPR
jgi:hypothetical protein